MKKFLTVLALAVTFLMPTMAMAQDKDKNLHLDLIGTYDAQTDHLKAFGQMYQEQGLLTYKPGRVTYFAGLGLGQLYGNQGVLGAPTSYTFQTYTAGANYKFNRKFDMTASYGLVPNNGILFPGDAKSYHQFEVSARARVF